MKKILLLVTGLILLGCAKRLQTKIYFIQGDENVAGFTELSIDPENFFFLKREEVFLPYYHEDSSVNEIPVRSFRPVRDGRRVLPYPPYDTVVNNIVEEKYIYLDSFNSAREGIFIQIKTARYFNNNALKDKYTDDGFLYLSTTRNMCFGHWFREDDGTIVIIGNNKARIFTIEATYAHDTLMYRRMSHPKQDANSLSQKADIMIDIEDVMYLHGEDGLPYFRNLNRSIVVENTAYPLTRLYYRIPDGKSDILKSEVVLECTSTAGADIRKYHNDRKIYIINPRAIQEYRSFRGLDRRNWFNKLRKQEG